MMLGITILKCKISRLQVEISYSNLFNKSFDITFASSDQEKKID